MPDSSPWISRSRFSPNWLNCAGSSVWKIGRKPLNSLATSNDGMVEPIGMVGLPVAGCRVSRVGPVPDSAGRQGSGSGRRQPYWCTAGWLLSTVKSTSALRPLSRTVSTLPTWTPEIRTSSPTKRPDTSLKSRCTWQPRPRQGCASAVTTISAHTAAITVNTVNASEHVRTCSLLSRPAARRAVPAARRAAPRPDRASRRAGRRCATGPCRR